jgi:hypothetical protein
MSKKIRVPTYGTSSVEFTNLAKGDSEKLMSALLRGNFWVTGNPDGSGISFVSTYEEIRAPMPDSDLLPYWDVRDDTSSPVKVFDHHDKVSSWSSPSITIQSLCGYYYSEENYVRQADKLTSYGFTEFRSKRDANGYFGSLWLLSFLLKAKGDLKDALNENIGDIKIDVAVDFLCENVQFGSLDTSVQRAAMTVD